MNKKYFKEFADLLLRTEDSLQTEDILKGIFTMQELEEVPKRLQIIKMLKKGVPQREIAKKLKVGISTVTRGSAELKKGRFKYL